MQFVVIGVRHGGAIDQDATLDAIARLRLAREAGLRSIEVAFDPREPGRMAISGVIENEIVALIATGDFESKIVSARTALGALFPDYADAAAT